MTKGDNNIHSVDKSIRLLEILLEKKYPLTLQQLAGLSGYPKSTIHALLSTMRMHNIIEQRPDGKYYLGIRLFELGCAVSSGWDISALSHPYLEQLANSTESSSFLCVIDNTNVITMDQYISPTGIQVIPSVGSRMPLHATSQGKLCLSLMSDKDVIHLMEQTGMPAFTPHTITEPAKMLASLSEIRRHGFAIEDGEYRIGLRSVSAPVYDSLGKVRYTLGVAGLFRRVSSDEFQNAISQLLFQAQQLSRMLGYRNTTT